jgi:ABC-2 type transport system permease protein
MLRSARASSISTSPRPRVALSPRGELAALAASWRAMTGERLYHLGFGGGMLLLLVMPVFQISMLAVVYGAGSELFAYAVVAQAANAFVLNTIFWVGEILDRERVKGTLVALFLAPCARFSWLTGFILSGLVETVCAAAIALLFGRYLLGVHLDPNVPALLLTLGLFLVSLWGLGVIFSGLGLILRKSNQLANLIYYVAIVLGGAFYPVAELPGWLRYPARCLPLGYGMQAIADATLRHASIRDLAPDLLPLTGFALVLPFVGALAFSRLERKVRLRGELDLY